MKGSLKYIVDEKGQKISVLVPIKVWDDLNQKCYKLQKKLEILYGIREGLSEVKQAKKSRKNLQTLNNFLK